MKKYLWFLFFGVLICALKCSLIYGSEVVLPATQIEKGKVSFLLLYGDTSEKLNFHVTGREQIRVGNNSYFSNVSNDLESDGRSSDVSVKLVINPDNGLYYWFKAGVSDYSLDIPSDTVKNNLSGQDKGLICGFGARKLLFPDTIVSPAVAVGLGVNYAVYGLDSFRSGDSAPVVVNDKLEITEFQADVVISKKLDKFEPYGGVKVYRKNVTLTDRASIANVSGAKDDAGLFFGTRFSYFKNEALIVEGSFVGDTSFTAGVNINF